MDPSEYENIFRNEDTHFFYLSVRENLAKFLERALPAGNARLLDAGCGTGGFLKYLSKLGDVCGVDVSDTAIEYASKNGLVCQKASIESLPFSDNSFDAVTCVDVIYHMNVGSEAQAVKELKRVLKPNGVLAMRVPAFECLFSAHDVTVQTRKRYRVHEVRQLLERAEFKIERLSYCHASLFLPAFLKAQIARLRPADGHSGVEETSAVVNNIVTAILRAENCLIQAGFDFSFGLGIIAIARKPDNARVSMTATL